MSTVPTWEPLRKTPGLPVWHDLLRPLAGALIAREQELADLALVHIRAASPAQFAEPTGAAQVRANVVASFHVLADALERGEDPRSLELPEGLRAGAVSRAQQGVPLRTLLRSFRFAHAVLTQWVTAEIFARASDPQRCQAAVALITEWLFAAVDILSAQYGQAYEVARESWLRGAAAIRGETIEAILTGREHDARRASARLGYDLDRHHVGLLAWLPSGEDNVGGRERIEGAIADLAARLGADGTLLEPLGLLAIRAWLGRPTAFVASALEALSGRRQPGLTIAVAAGEPAAGLDGFRRTAVEAEHSRRVAGLLHRRPGSVTRYATIEPLAIASLDGERTRVFVQRALGGLARDDDASRRLAATLAVYLEENGSRARAAKRLGIHENTVTYRVRQAEALVGHPVDAEPLRLRLALALLPTTR